jgi:hypothetical protein
MSKCARPGCLIPAKSSCSVCDREHYCSSSCQKLDWKAHISMCPTLKKLSSKLQPFHVVIQTFEEILESEFDDIRILKHLLSYVEYQFGKVTTGKDYREREDGEYVSNWNVDIDSFHQINFRLTNHFSEDKSLSSIRSREMMLPCLQRSLSLLNPWLIHLDSDGSSKLFNLNKEEQWNTLLKQLFLAEERMALIATQINQLDIAEGHCQRCLAYSRRYRIEGEEKIRFIYRALNTYSILRRRQDNFEGSRKFAEECYNLVVVAYDCVF